jgi:hypothetical protein
MADVSVEFGAKDTGLEQTLKTVQDELSRLDEKVKGGELSFNELQSTMKKVAQAERLQAQLEGMAQATGEAGNAAGAAAPKVDQIGQETKKAGKEAKDFGEKSKGGFLKMAGAVAAGQLAAEAAMAGIKAAINLAKASIDEFGAALDLGGRLSDLAARTGEAEGNLLLLERAFTNTGASAEQVGPVINKLQKFMEDAAAGGSTQTAAMERLGLSYEELAGKTPTQQLEILAQRISEIEDPGQRAAAAMGVFGEEGAQLIPFLTNFSGSMGTARDQLGGMVEIMNTNAATFNEVGKKIDGIKGKFMEFAAGILDRIVPALNAVTEGLSRIDAAAIGQKLADAFLGGTQAMQGFQAAVDAFKVGRIQDALSVLWESVKLQALQTADEIYKKLVAAFNAIGRFAGEIFDPSGALVRTILDTFSMVGKEISVGIQRDLAAALGGNWLTEGIALQLNTAANETQIAANKIEDGLKGAAGRIAKQFGDAGREFPKTFGEEYEKTSGIFGDLDARAAALKAKQDEITAAVEKTNEEKGKGAPVDEKATEEAEKQNRINAEIAAEKAKMEGLQNALNAAIQSGNELEADTIRRMIEGEESKARIKKLTEDYIATGLGEKEAAQLATNLVNSEIAAANFKKNSEGAKNELGGAGENAKTVKGLMDEIANAKMEASPERLKERTIDARKELKGMADFIGDDLSQMPLDDIIDKLGLDPEGKLKTTDDKLKAVEGAIKKIGGADPADITPDVDLVGVNDRLESVKGYLAEIGKKKTDATPEINQVEIGKQAKAAIDTIEKTMKKTPAEVALDAKKSIGEIRESLAKEMDLALSSSEGTKHLSSIDKLVDAIKSAVDKIEGKLPMQALA